MNFWIVVLLVVVANIVARVIRHYSRKPVRDISRLHTSPESTDQVSEVVDTSGGPLKEKHLRITLRDSALLPKRESLAREFGMSAKRRRYMTADRAGRLFSSTLRTSDRNIRDLLPDEDQLKRYGLPLWLREEDVAGALEISVMELRYFSIHRNAEKIPHYVCFSIPKATGGRRLILAPKRRLKAIQRRLNELLVSKLPVSENAHGFRKLRSIRTNAEPHVARALVFKIDIKDFFPAVTYARVRGLLIALGYGYPVAATLAVLMTESERQRVKIEDRIYHVPVGPRHCPQGAPTSPGLCNAIAFKMDRRLAGLARKHKFAYTRYADDMTFSGPTGPSVRYVCAGARKIVREEGFEVNEKKTRLARSGRRQRIAGVTVNDQLGLSRHERRLLRAEIHHMKLGRKSEKEARSIRGKLAYLSMLNPAQAQPLLQRYEQAR